MVLELGRASQLSQTTNSLDWMKGGSGESNSTNFNATSQAIAPIVIILIILLLLRK